MTGILGDGSNAKTRPAAGSLQFQHAQQGGVIPLLWGATRVAVNLLDYQGFTAVAQSGKGSGKAGGKGADGKGNTEYKYSVSLILGICQGPEAGGSFSGQFLCWYDKNILPLARLPGISFINNGTDGQGPDPYWVTSFENDAIGYSGTMWFSLDAFQLGYSPTLPNFSVEVLGPANAVNQSDGNPADIVVDFLTNERYGAGFPAANLDASGSIADWGNYCDAVGIFLAPLLDQQTQAQNALSNIAQLTVSAIVWSGNLLKVIPYGDTPIAATYWIVEAGGTFTAGDTLVLTFASAGLGSVSVSYGVQPSNVNTDTVDPSGPMGQLAKAINANGNLTGYGISGGVGVGATVIRMAGADQTVTVTPSTDGSENFTVIGPIAKSWTPNTTVQYSLDDDDFIVQESSVGTYLGVTPGSPALRLGAGPVTGGFTSDPVRVKRTSPADVANYVQLECLDRAYSYNSQIVEVFDQGMVDLYGVRKDTSLKARAIVDPAMVGPTVAQLTLQRSIAYRDTYEFSLGWQYCLLEPMDLVEITDPYLGLSKVVRITSVAEDEEGVLNFTAEDFFGAVGDVDQYGDGAAGTPPSQISPKQTAAPTASVPYFNAPVDAETVAAPFILQPPPQLLQAQGLNSIGGGTANGPAYVGSPYLILGLSGTGSLWGGARVWVSLDGESFSYFGTFAGRSTMGELDSGIAAGDTSIAVDLSESDGQLNSVSPLVAANNITLFAISDADGGNLEYFSYETATLVSGYLWTLSGVNRGLYGTAATAHAAGSRLLYLGDGQYFSAVLPTQYLGVNLYFKFPAFNLVGQAGQALANVPIYEFTAAGQQLNPGFVVVDFPMAIEAGAAARADPPASLENF
jgi:Putative phage tail protein